MKLPLPIIALLALVTLATCYRPPVPPQRYLPPPTQNHFRRPHPPAHSHQPAHRYPPRPRHPFPRQPIAPPPRFAPAPLQYKPVQHVAPQPYQLQQVDDDSGPIHTIPAPKLGPHDRPAHLNVDHSHSSHLDGIPQRIVSAEPLRPAFFGAQQEQQFLSHQQAYLDSNDVAGRTADGSHAYYAPDPDPSLPTRRIPPTFDPHSSPSNGRPPPADLLPALQENTHQTLDSYGVPVVLHSFDYQEPYRRASNQVAATAIVQGFYGQRNPSVEEAYYVANQRRDHVQEAVPRVNHVQGDSRRADEDGDKVGEDDSEKVAFFEKVDGPVYSVLPNQEVAETLATLAAAGNINSNIISKAKDVQEAEDYVEEEILKAGPLEKADDDREYITDEDKEVQLVFGTRIKQ